MECINPECNDPSYLERLFGSLGEDEELPKFCPNCGGQSTLRRSVVEKAKEENTTSEANKNERPLLQDEEKSAEAIKECQDQSTEENSTTSTVVKDEKPATVVTVYQYSIGGNSTKMIESDATKAKDFSDNGKEEQSEGDTVCPITPEQGLQMASMSRQTLSKPSSTSSLDKTDLTKSYQHRIYIDKDQKQKEKEIERVNDLHDSSNSTSTASVESNELAKKEHNYNTRKQASQNSSQTAGELNSQDKNEISQVVRGYCGMSNTNEANKSDPEVKEGNDRNVTIFGQDCVFGRTAESSLSSIATHDPQLSSDCNQVYSSNQQDLSQGKGQKVLMISSSKQKEECKDISNNEKIPTNPANSVDKVHTETESENTTNLQDETKEYDDDSGSDYSEADQDLEPEEEVMPSGKKGKTVPYDKSVINKKKKERKERKKKGVKRPPKINIKKVEVPQQKEMNLKAQKDKSQERQQESKLPENKQPIKEPSSSPLEQNEPEQQQLMHEQSNRQTMAASTPSFDTMNEDCVTIIFHALLSPDFQFKRREQVIAIRAGHPELGQFGFNCADIKPISETTDKFLHVYGEMLLPVRLLQKPIPYKYVIWSTKERKVQWEYSEFGDDYYGAVVNRSLILFDQYKRKGAIWHQYDGIIYSNPHKETSKWKFWEWRGYYGFDRDKVLKNRQYAAKTFLPKWKGFITNTTECESMSVTEAIEQTHAISECLGNVYLHPGYDTKKTVMGLEFEKILANFLKPKLEYNANLSQRDLKRSDVRVDRLVSSLAITHLIAYYKLDLAYVQLQGIMHGLVLRASGSDRCDFDEIHKHFPEEMWSDLVPSIIHLMKVANDKHSCPDMVLVVPLLHFLRKDLKPFEEPEVTQPKTVQEWCRTKGLPQYKPYDRFVEVVLPEALPMFTLDPLLRRLFLCFTPLDDFHKLSHHMAFPVHEICIALFFKIRSENVLSSKFDVIHETLTELAKRLQTRRQRGEVFQQSEAMLNAKTAKYLLKELQKQVQIKDKLFLTGVQFAVDALCYVDCREEERKTVESERCDQGNDDELKHQHEIFPGIIDVVRRTMEKGFYSKLSSFQESQVNELKAWTSLLNLKVSSNSLQKNWTNSLVSLFEERLKTMNDEEVIHLFCKVEMEESFHQTLVQSITQYAFNVVEQMIERGGSGEQAIVALRKKSLQSVGTSKAGELLSRMLTRAWSKEMRNKTVKDQDVLLYALKWKPWTGFISSYDSLEKQKILTQDANNLLQQVIGCLLSIQDALADGSIDVRTLTSLNQYQDNFIQLCCALTKIHHIKSEKNQKPSVNVQMNLKKRNEEYALFQTMKKHIQDFINICTSNREVAFAFEQLETKANCDTSGERISDLCKRIPSSDNLVEERIEVVFFGDLSSEFLSSLPRLSAAHKSRIFQGIWKRECKAVYREKQTNPMLSGELTLLDVQHKVWQPSIDKWTDLAQSIYDGSIHLKDIDRTFREIDTAGGVKQELHILFLTVNEAQSFIKDRIASERTAQITRYRGLQNYIEAAETVWEFKEALGLTGDFTVIEEIRNQASEEFKDKHLKSIDEKFTSAGENLKSISLENSHCLDAVIKCGPLVKWLRETIKDTSALSTLVDLAMISAGENDLEVDRISNFHTSCLNFAPLIFDLSKEYGFEDLMTACKPVWEAVKADKKLSKKLEETCRHLEWLKAVQSSHGSVEMSSIMQAKAINSTGVFRVGQILQDPNISLSVSNGRKDLDSVLTLAIPIDQRTRDPRRQQGEEMMDFKDMEELKTYTLNDLKDLQSKLMLIAGKTAQLQNKDCIESTEEINRFVEVLEGMMRLGQVYIDLCEAGEVKYLEWSKEVHCSDSRLSTQRSVAEELAKTSRAMEERLKKWRNHVHEKRLHYKQLNHYTTRQILVMRRELGLLREGVSASDLPLQVYALLESVLQDVTSRDLNQVLMETLGFETEIQRNTTADIMMPSPAPHQGSFRSANLREKYQSFLFSVEKMDFDEEVAVAALKANDVINNHDVNEIDLITWCMNNGEDEETVSEWLEKARDDRNYTDFFPDLWQEEEEEVQDTELERSFSYDQDGQIEAPNSEEQLQDEFEQHPYLTLDELGSVLARLSSKCVKLDSRRFPDYLRHEQPNLILVPKGDILPTVLTLYMQYGGDSLPTPNEVLVCTHETTAEEVELFWWRALEDTSQQLFCLVNPDVLDYNVSQTAVNMLNILMHEFTTEGCRIIILCSTENEDRSHIIAALDEYRLNVVPSCASADVLSEYLAKQFTRSMSLTGYFNEKRVSWIPAAHLDHDSLSVRLVCSDRAGVGKSLVVTRLFERISSLQNNLKVAKVISNIPLTVTVPLHGTTANTGPLIDGLWQHPVRGDLPVSRIVHLDVSPSVLEGLDTLLFNLLVLGVLCDSNGHLWRRKPSDLYVIEMTTLVPKVSGQTSAKPTSVAFVSLLPTINCVAPKTTLQNLKTGQNTKSPLFDDQEYRSVPVQLAFQYLRACDVGQSLERFHFTPGSLVGTQAECLALIIKHCGIKDPSWSELKHFVDFLHSQIQDCEESIYCKAENVDDQWMQGTLKGFKSFVVRFMVTMSRDFATPSLDDNPVVCSPGLSEEDDDEDEDIKPLQLRRRWESSPHPYIFFNQDRITMTFLGFHINPNGDLIDPDTKTVIQSALMTKQLRNGLELQRVDFKTNYSAWSKQDRINKLCSVMGVNERFDPDTSYELTIDNMKKILAILMRFRCGIPVVIMGETGCGKTRLIRYMCALQAGTKGQRNMLLMKVHGGTSYEDVIKKVEQVEKMAAENEKQGIDTVLFFDEANTTNALGMIKEVMVDRRINGRPVGVGLRRLHFIAACNPYRRHTDKMIEKLESAGLGYSVKSNETKDKLGKIPLRQLVYRVHALPASMRPLVWDFGQLKPEIEELYILQIVNRYVVIEKCIPGNDRHVKAISNVLAVAQRHMRKQQDECSFVSLRDVERTMTVMTWFYKHHIHLRTQATSSKKSDEEDNEMVTEDEDEGVEPMDMITWSLVLSLGVCYHAKLQDRSSFRKAVVSACSSPLNLNGGPEQMYREIDRCQKVMINELNLGPNIARNTALSENVFMMVVCIELRIPLFVIGKPGSSKSLAKTVVADNMQGDASRSQLFKTFKRAHMVSYQCSPLSTPEGIVATFRQCRRLQENNPDKFASVVVLDEVGLAEDSPLMPLKTLHPLLEDGVTSSDDIIETDEKPTRVAFIGISNWALDPAKMNRGLMLMRGEPSEKELQDSAWGICAEREDVRTCLSTLLNQLAAGYAHLYKKQKEFESLRKSKRDEFFGLRDFYSLVKMVYSIAAQKKGKPTWTELEHAIRRNFGGLDEIDAVEIFREHVIDDDMMQDTEPVDTLDLLRASLDHKNTIGESRYLLVLTENYSALRIVEQQLIKNKDDYIVIFGSSFPKDQEYTQVCRNINQIKVCMETGRTVVLLNLENLYESLYDALNQYYVYCADQKYVDLGLGSHRVKCRVDDSFRLIVIAEKDVVYKKFPIPLINRLEKHYLVPSKSLKPVQMDLVQDLKTWAEEFAEVRTQRHESQQDFKIGDAFIGYQSDTIPAMVLQVCAEFSCHSDEAALEEWIRTVKERCQNLLIQCATPDAMARLSRTNLKFRANHLWDIYFRQQEHTSLPACLKKLLDVKERRQGGLLVQVSTHSRLLSENDLADVCQVTCFKRRDIELLTLQQFQTEQQFLKQVREFFVNLSGNEGILLVQCDSGDDNFNLIACTRHLLMDQRNKREEMLMEKLKIDIIPPIHIVIIVQLPRVKGGCTNFVGFQGGQWDSFHVDDLRPPTNQIPPIQALIDKPVSELLKPVDDKSALANDQTQNEKIVPTEEEEGDAQMKIDDADDDVFRQTLPCSPSEQEKLSVNHARFDPIVLLRRSVQAAAGRLEDDPVMAKRATERIDLILSLLPEDSSKMPDGPSFPRTLHLKIYNLLLEKDEKQTSIDLARHWVRNEALSGTSMHERGTFRRALQHKVLSEVEPLLAKVFAFTDRDCNLNLLLDQDPWISRLWISIFDNKSLSEMYYEISRTMIRERVQVSGRGKHAFRCCFPFSWLIKEIIDELWRGTPDVSSRSGENEEAKLRGIMENSELRYILVIIKEERKEDEAARRYLHDFVHMVYQPSKENQDEEIQLVSRAIIATAEKRSKGETPLDFAAIHVAFNMIQSRLNNFKLLVQAEPDLTTLLLENPHPQLTIDVAALMVCLEKLQPCLIDIEASENRNQWCGRVLNIRKSIEAMTSKEVFSRKCGETGDYEEEEKNILQKCWMMWQHLSVVRLFIDHVCCMFQQPNAQNSQNVLKLWKVFDDDTNFMKATCISHLESFLLECSQENRKRNHCFDEVTCVICLGAAKQPSVTPCGHCCCLECASRWFSEQSSCPSCRQPVSADYTPTESQHMREALNNVTRFRNQCNSFFMEVVSLFSFGYSPCGTLEEDAYKLLMDYVTDDKARDTKPFSPFPDQGIDVTPVVRSFLLQQLLKSSDTKVKEYMEVFIRRARDVMEMDVASSVEVFVMCIQCMEDALDSKFNKRVSELPLDSKMRILENDFKAAAAILREAREDEPIDVKWLEGIANTRYVLSKAAEFMYRSRSDTTNTWSHPDVNRALNRLIVEVKNICVQTLLTTPRLFLLKQFSRKFGFESIDALAKEFDWILPPEAKVSSDVIQDRFLVYGLEYQRLRETVSRSLVSGDMDGIKEVLENMTSSTPVTSVALMLGVYQEVTANKQIVISSAIQESLEDFLQQSEHINAQSRVFARDLVTGTEGNIRAVFRIAGDNTWDRSMVEIIIHLAAVLFSRDNDDLVSPLRSLALYPGTTADSFLPSMPDDQLQYARAALVEDQKLYECPNGHPYLVTECGRPTEKSRCRARGCGAEIGGTNHQLTASNRSARTTDLSTKGHCLGSPAERESVPVPEREMSALVTCLVRLLVHGSMLIGSCYHTQDLCRIFSPAVPEDSVQESLWKHVMCDMRLLSQASGRSVDDTALTVHLVLQRISRHAQMNQGHYDVLRTKDQRKLWEKLFSFSIIVPLLENLESDLQQTMRYIVNDERFGANPLLRQLYELESGEDESEVVSPNCIKLWRYRTPVTLDHVTRAFNESVDAQDDNCVVLGEFLKQEHKLRAVRFLPDVVKLQKLVMDRYHRTLDRTETDQVKWKDFEKRLPKGVVKEYKALRQSFRSAWSIMAATLAEQGTGGTLKKVSQCKVGDDSPMSMFIPDTSGYGICSLTLLQFLVQTHNEFMELYRRYSGSTILQEVSVMEVTCSQLVSYDADRDLLPLIHAHCHYSLEVGHGTTVEYDWPALQRQLVDRLVRGRVLIDFKENEYLKTAQISAESVLTALKSKIPQVELSLAIQNQIIQQCRSLQDICEGLSCLNTAIKFLASGGGRPDMLISRYIHEVLKIPKDAGLRNTKAQEVCQIQNAVSLWRLLSIERAKILTKRGQDPFEHLSPDFKQRLPEGVELSLNNALRSMNEGCLDVFVSFFFEFIFLHLNDELDINKDYSLRDYVEWHLDDKDADPIHGLENIPERVLLKHVVRFWQIVLGMSDRYHERRMQATGSRD